VNVDEDECTSEGEWEGEERKEGNQRRVQEVDKNETTERVRTSI